MANCIVFGRRRPAPRFYLFVSLGSALGAFYVGVVAPQVFFADYDLVSGLTLGPLCRPGRHGTMGVDPYVFWPAAALAMAWVAWSRFAIFAKIR